MDFKRQTSLGQRLKTQDLSKKESDLIMIKKIGKQTYEDTETGRRDLTLAEKKQAIVDRYGFQVMSITESEKAQAYKLYRQKYNIK